MYIHHFRKNVEIEFKIKERILNKLNLISAKDWEELNKDIVFSFFRTGDRSKKQEYLCDIGYKEEIKHFESLIKQGGSIITSSSNAYLEYSSDVFHSLKTIVQEFWRINNKQESFSEEKQSQIKKYLEKLEQLLNDKQANENFWHSKFIDALQKWSEEEKGKEISKLTTDFVKEGRDKHKRFAISFSIIIGLGLLSIIFTILYLNAGDILWSEIKCLRFGGSFCKNSTTTNGWIWLIFLIVIPVIKIAITEYRKQIHNYLKYDFAYRSIKTGEATWIQNEEFKDIHKALILQGFNNLETGYSENLSQQSFNIDIPK